MNFKIRSELPKDFKPIFKVNHLAFGRTNEGELVSLLRNKPNFESKLSLIYSQEDQCLGHLLLFPISSEILSLGPVAVLPNYQRQNIGSLLIQRGIKDAKKLGYSLIVVIGHPKYYPRFGSKKASSYKISSNYTKVPDEAFMVYFLKLDVAERFKNIKILFPSEYKIAD